MIRFQKRFSRIDRSIPARSLVLGLLLWIAGCKNPFEPVPEYMYVSVPQAMLRDSTATVYTKLLTLQNGERVQVLGHEHGFVKVRSGEATEGWIDRRYLVSQDVFDGFAQLAAFHAHDTVQTRGSARDDVNMHITPSREAEKLYQLRQGSKIELLSRVSTPRGEIAVPGAAKPSAVPSPAQGSSVREMTGNAAKTSDPSPQSLSPQNLEDWWLVRDARGHVGWIVSRLIDVDVPIAITEAGYAQGQRPVATMVLATVIDPSINGPDKKVPCYLMLFTENKDGLPYDYSQVRVFIWNMRRAQHRYELAYHERGLYGLFPAGVGKEDFGGQGLLPVFTLRVKTNAGEEVRSYKLDGDTVKRMLPSEARPTATSWETQLSSGSGGVSERVLPH